MKKESTHVGKKPTQMGRESTHIEIGAYTELELCVARCELFLPTTQIKSCSWGPQVIVILLDQ